MDEIQQKVLSGNVYLQTQAMTSLCEDIIGLKEKGLAAIVKSSQLNKLWEYANQGEMTVAVLSVESLIRLTQLRLLEPASVLQNFVADFASAKNPAAVIQGVTHMLLLLCESASDKDKPLSCPFTGPPKGIIHPYVRIITRRPDVTPSIIQEVDFLLNHTNQRTNEAALKILEPLIYHCFCLTEQAPPATHSLLHSLMSAHTPLGEDLIRVLTKAIIHIKSDGASQLQRKIDLLVTLTKVAIDQKIKGLSAALLPCLIMSLSYSMKYGLPTRTLESLVTKLVNEKTQGCDICVCALASALPTTSGTIQVTLLNVATVVISKRDGNPLIAGRLLPSLLQILSGSCLVVSGLSMSAVKLAALIQATPAQISTNAQLSGNAYWDTLSLAYPDLRTFQPMVDLSNEIMKDSHCATDWLSKLAATMHQVSSFHYSILTSILLYQGSTAQSVLEAIKVIESEVNKKKCLAVELFPIVLFRLSRERDPITQLKLLYLLPAIAVDKLTVSRVVKTLMTLWASTNLRHIILRLMLNLWQIEPRIYPYLHKLIHDQSHTTEQLQIARAFVVTSICKQKPSHHGEELLSVLSGFLNEYRGGDGTPQTMIALEGITALCVAVVIDLRTVWQVIGPKLVKDKRAEVIVRLCQVLSVAPNVHIKSEEYDHFVSGIVTILWGWACSRIKNTVNEAALKALQLFDPVHFRLKMLPTYAREGLKMPEELVATPFDAGKKAEEVLTHVTPTAWIKLAAGCPKQHSQYVELFLKAVVEREVMSLPRGIYLTAVQEAKKRGIKSVGTQPEPPTYNFFHHTSLVKYAVSFLQDFSKNFTECSGQLDEAEKLLQAASIILNSLGQPLNRPLPALNWSFLNEVKTAVEKWNSNKCEYWSQRIRQGIFRVTAQQCNKSGSASSVISKWLSVPASLAKQDELELLNVLDQLGRGITPLILQTFLAGVLEAHLDDAKHLEVLLRKIRTHMSSDIIQGPNRSVVNNVIEGLNDKIDRTHVTLHEAYRSCVEDLPQKNIERMTSPSSWWESTDEKLYAAAILRCHVAANQKSANGLVWLNDLVDAAATLPGDRSHFLLVISEVLIERSRAEESTMWLITLLGRLREHLKRQPADNIDTAHEQQQRIMFYVDLLVMSLVIWSGSWAITSPQKLIDSVELRNDLLLAGVVSLHSREDWARTMPQILNWLLLSVDELQKFVGHKYDLLSMLLVLASLSGGVQQGLWNKVVAITLLS